MTTEHVSAFWLPLLLALAFGTGCVTSTGKFTPFQLSISPEDARLFDETYDVRGLRINLWAGVNRNLAGLDLGAMNACRGSMTGLQMGALSSWVSENVNGVQLAGMVVVCEKIMRGTEISGVMALCGKGAVGLQAAGVFARVEEEFSGLQFSGLVSSARSDMAGVQIGTLLASSEGRVSGLQLGTVSLAEVMNGLQASLLLSAAGGDQRGCQLSMVANINGETRETSTSVMRGIQIGLINYAEHLGGVQIGLVNVSRDGGLRLCPFINCWFFSPRRGSDAEVAPKTPLHVEDCP